jgi:ATP-dependent exoDNAse (exonuclease V) alpha subunit
MTEAARIWAAAGRPVVGITPSQFARNTLTAGVAESYNTVQFLGHLPGQRGARARLGISEGTLLLVDESSMIPSPDLADPAQERSAKMVLAGDAGQLQAVENGGAMSLLADALGYVRLADRVQAPVGSAQVRS